MRDLYVLLDESDFDNTISKSLKCVFTFHGVNVCFIYLLLLLLIVFMYFQKTTNAMRGDITTTNGKSIEEYFLKMTIDNLPVAQLIKQEAESLEPLVCACLLIY
jgi:hypothetical protein